MIKTTNLYCLIASLLCSSATFSQYVPPRNTSGKPDLQDYWSNASLTTIEKDTNYADLGLIIPPELVAEITYNHPQVVRQATDDNQVWKQLPDGADLSRGRGYNAFMGGSRFSICRGKRRNALLYGDSPSKRVDPIYRER